MGMYHSGSRNVSYTYEIFRNGSKLLDIYAENASITMAYDGEIKTSLSGTFLYDPMVDYLNDTINVCMTIDGIKYPIGVFIAANVTDHYSNGRKMQNIEAYDKALILKQSRIESQVYYQAGNKYLDIIQSLMLDAGISLAIIEGADYTLRTAREDWEIGTSYLEIINQLLSEINYKSLWFDAEGNARVEKYIPPSSGNINHTYGDGQFSIMQSDYQTAVDTYQSYNVFTVVVSSPDNTSEMVSTKINDNPDSPLSTTRRGRRIPAPIEKIDNIANQAALDEYVNNIMAQSMLANQEISFVTLNMPNHGVGDIVALQHDTIDGIFLETGWQMELSYSGLMQHTAKRVMQI